MPDEADEAGGHQPANEKNEVRCGFSPEKPCLPLSIEGIESTSNSATGNIVIFIYIPFHNRVNRSVIKILSPYHI